MVSGALNMARTKITAQGRKNATASKMKAKAGGAAAAIGVGQKEKRRHRFRPGTVAIREIKRYQKSVDLLLPRAPVKRLIREIAQPYRDELRFSKQAMEALQEASESYIVDLFADANVAAIEHERKTVTARDIRLALLMRHDVNLPHNTDLPPREHKVRKTVPSKRRVRKPKTEKVAEVVEERQSPVNVLDLPPAF